MYGAARFAMICHALRVQVHGSPWPRKPLARQWLDAQHLHHMQVKESVRGRLSLALLVSRWNWVCGELLASCTGQAHDITGEGCLYILYSIYFDSLHIIGPKHAENCEVI